MSAGRNSWHGSAQDPRAARLRIPAKLTKPNTSHASIIVTSRLHHVWPVYANSKHDSAHRAKTDSAQRAEHGQQGSHAQMAELTGRAGEEAKDGHFLSWYS